MNPKQRKRKIRERSKKFVGVVSSLKAEPMLTVEMLNYILIEASDMGLHTIAKIAYDAMEVMRSKAALRKAVDVAERCQSQLADAQAKIMRMEQTIRSYETITFRRRSRKAKATRPEKRHYAR